MDTLKKKWKYLIFPRTDKIKEVLIKYTELWEWITNLTEKNFMKIKFNSDDNLPLKNMTIVVRSVIVGAVGPSEN